MTDTLSTRPTTEAVKAYMEASDHPIRWASADAETESPLEQTDAQMPEGDGSTADSTDEGETAADDAAFPEPPVRGSLDDDDLVPLVGRHTTDTATVDLIGILQAQMQLRAEEAARFAVWEEQMRLIGTDEALGELERTRLHFTGVIPVQTAPTIVTADAVPQSSRIVPERVEKAPSPVVTVTAVPDTGENPHVQRAREADERLLEIEDDTVPSAVRQRNATRPPVSGGRILLVAVTTLSVAAVAAAVAAALGLPFGALTAALASAAVLGAAWLGIVAGRLALRPRDRAGASAPVTRRTAWALVAGLVAGAAIGEGVVRTGVDGFAWQGYLIRLVALEGFGAVASIVAGLAVSLLVAFVIVVVVDRGRARPSA